jgi:hypothetical protein
MFELTNKSEAKKHFSHFLFHNDDNNTVAIADHSIANLKDPSSTEDGLLVWTGQMGRIVNTLANTQVLVDVMQDNTEPTTVIIDMLTACRIEQLTGLQLIPMNVEIADYKNLQESN